MWKSCAVMRVEMWKKKKPLFLACLTDSLLGLERLGPIPWLLLGRQMFIFGFYRDLHTSWTRVWTRHHQRRCLKMVFSFVCWLLDIKTIISKSALEAWAHKCKLGSTALYKVLDSNGRTILWKQLKNSFLAKKCEISLLVRHKHQ